MDVELRDMVESNVTEPKSEQTYKQMLAETHEGAEIWTDNLPKLGDRVVVGIGVEDGEAHVIEWGVRHEITEKQAKAIWNEFFEQEFGTTDLSALWKAGVI